MEFYLSELVDTGLAGRSDLLLEVMDHSSTSKQIAITGARAIELASESEITFCKTESADLVVAAARGNSRFLIARPEILPLLPGDYLDDHVLILSNRPRLLLALLAAPFDSRSTIAHQTEVIHPAAFIAPGVVLGPGVTIGENVTIESECIIGPNTVIDHAVIGQGTQIGYNCSIGSDGFSFEVDDETGNVIKFPHFGRVRIGRNVTISSNCGIARGSLRDTILEDDVKLDNLVHVAHNCHVKRGAFLTANAMLAGSVTIGEHVWIGPSTSVMNGVTIGRCAMTGLGAVVTKDVGDNALVAGVPARKLRDRLPPDHPLMRA
jgi:UDP-3-O-[3-hydroxymyristoyl] glucosamine N-acyltransferase